MNDKIKTYTSSVIDIGGIHITIFASGQSRHQRHYASAIRLIPERVVVIVLPLPCIGVCSGKAIRLVVLVVDGQIILYCKAQTFMNSVARPYRRHVRRNF